MRILSSTEPEEEDIVFTILLILVHTILSHYRQPLVIVRSYHVFHPRDLHFLNSSVNFLKYCFSCNLNSLFMYVRSFFESCLNQ
jgi:hypothetical protein